MDRRNAELIFAGLSVAGIGSIFIGAAYFGINGTVQASSIAIATALVSFITGIKVAEKVVLKKK